jgi:SPP1 gp7 family putative phage head morphogenesis protein
MLAESQRNESFVANDANEELDLAALIQFAATLTFNQFTEAELSQLLGPIYERMGAQYAATIAKDLVRVAPDVLNAPQVQSTLAATMAKSTNATVQVLLETQPILIANTQKVIAEGVQTGKRWETIAKELQGSIEGDAYRTAVNRAKFVARNEVTTALGEINKTQQEAAGVDLYVWETADDERVRDTHRELDGKIFTWEGTATEDGVTYVPASDANFNGGAPTIPGEPWNCRCVGIAYVPELDDP